MQKMANFESLSFKKKLLCTNKLSLLENINLRVKYEILKENLI